MRRRFLRSSSARAGSPRCWAGRARARATLGEICPIASLFGGVILSLAPVKLNITPLNYICKTSLSLKVLRR